MTHAATKTSSRAINTTRASDIAPLPAFWLWDARIPLTGITLLAGREGTGKTTLAAQLAADVTRGRLQGQHFGNPKSVLVLAAEDAWAQVVVPRLMASDADLDRVFALEDPLTFPRDVEALEAVVREHDAGLVVFDPIISRLDAGLDTHKDSDVRTGLEPLTAMTERLLCPVLGLIHVNKSQGTDLLTSVMGSRAFTNVPRAVLFVLADPDDPTVSLLGQAKNNYGRKDLPTLTFTISGHTVRETAAAPIMTSRLEWGAETSRNISDFAQEIAPPKASPLWEVAGEWLVDFLSGRGGECESDKILEAASLAGHSPDSTKRARMKLGITTENLPVTPRRTIWCLPPAQRGEVSRHGLGETSVDPLTALTRTVGLVSAVAPSEATRVERPDWDGLAAEACVPERLDAA